METFKKERDHLTEIGVLLPVHGTEWGLPMFVIPKNDGCMHWVSDMWELDKVTKRMQCTLSTISDVLMKREGCEFLSKPDILMQCSTFMLDEARKKLCAIVNPFGPFCYNQVPMGLKISPDHIRAWMEEVLWGIEEVQVCFDDTGVFSKSWEYHLEMLNAVLQGLEDNGFTVIPLKCEWGVKEMDWLEC